MIITWLAPRWNVITLLRPTPFLKRIVDILEEDTISVDSAAQTVAPVETA